MGRYTPRPHPDSYVHDQEGQSPRFHSHTGKAQLKLTCPQQDLFTAGASKYVQHAQRHLQGLQLHLPAGIIRLEHRQTRLRRLLPGTVQDAQIPHGKRA